MWKDAIIGVLLLVTGILIGVNLPALSAQQREGRGGPPPLPTQEQLPQEIATLKLLIPTNSTIMMDVQWHWTNLWLAGKKRNWPLAQYYFNEARGHILQLVRKNPTIRNQADGTDVALQGIFDGIDTSSLAMVKDAIAKKDGISFDKNYKDHAGELLLVSQERRSPLHPAADSDRSGASDRQHGSERNVASIRRRIGAAGVSLSASLSSIIVTSRHIHACRPAHEPRTSRRTTRYVRASKRLFPAPTTVQ